MQLNVDVLQKHFSHSLILKSYRNIYYTVKFWSLTETLFTQFNFELLQKHLLHSLILNSN